ncbi:Aflatoxin B1 aldehyde reductase member 2 (rAFAR2) (Succinic semialdehyde reductase) (SSA reductase) [Durusdinium trenchii]|uniref:Aflatoxin B1 aldehyde reductase member 2 (RAFAR2) (Succinic semialdehyde reductase) (SSA reductase) n=1 Tax=Durusdinium trenchii TaxID=1381693 RepID=A0ABP0S7U9_9DINO
MQEGEGNGRANGEVARETKEVTVLAGDIHNVPVDAERGDLIQWGFQTEGGDIAFCVLLEKPDGDVQTLVSKDRVPSEDAAEEGNVMVEETGVIWLQWDNSYSWFKNKHLTFSVSVEPGGGDSARNGSNASPKTGSAQDGAAAVIFVLGGPGSGKGTQCALLTEGSEYVHLSAGDLLRAERVNPESKDGALIDAYIKEGKIVPIEITVKLLLNAMKANPSSCFLIDGFPRNQDNWDGWVRETAHSNVSVLGALFFDCPDDVITARLLERGKSSGRADDNADTIKKRLATYHKDTKPIIQLFADRNELWTINTHRSVAAIFAEVKPLVNGLVFGSGSPSAAGAGNGAGEGAGGDPDDQLARAEAQETSSAIVAPSKNPNIPLRVVLGTMTMAGQVDRDTSEQMLDLFAGAESVKRHLTAGRAELDTATMYQHGATERLLGSILGKRGDLKPGLLLASKVNPFKGYGDSLRPESVRKQCLQALNALKLDTLDVLYLHAPDHGTRIESTLQAMQELYLEGRFRELGLSNYSAWETVHIYHLCKQKGYVLPTLYQGMYNAITRDVERELLPALKTLGIRFYAYNPLAGGFLSGKHAAMVQFPKDGRFGESEWGIKYRDRFWKPEYFEALDLVKAACKRSAIPMAAASVRWVMHHSELVGGDNDAIILGASSLRHLEENLNAAAQGPLPAHIVASFDQAWAITKAACPSYSR